jgi:DNA-binding transcriptional regulator YiaG
MPNLAIVLKDEIRRLAKKEVRAEVGSTRRAVVQYRRDIARLKREMQDQQKEISFLKAQERKRLGQPQAAEEPQEKARFSARSVQAQRRRLKLSAEEFGRLVGVSSLTVYSWEHGKSRPRNAQFASLVAVRGLGRREALKKLETLKADRKKVKKLRRKSG